MRWDPQLIAADILAVHAALLHNGEILFFTGNEFWEMQHNNHDYDHVRLFNCQTGNITKVVIPSNISDLFCCGHALTGSGNLLLAGGTKAVLGHGGHIHSPHWIGERRTWLFDVREKQLIECANLNTNPDNPDSAPFSRRDSGGRWYPTLITLGNGQILAIGGHPDRGDDRHSAWFPEYYEWNNWRYAEGGRDPDINFDNPANPLEYPRLHLLPDGRVFSSTPFIGNHVEAYRLNAGWERYPRPTPNNDDWRKDPTWFGSNNSDGYYQIYNQFNGTSVLLPLTPENNYQAKVMIHGNTHSYVIDLSTSDPRWEIVHGRPLSQRRLTVNSVILPTGEIFFCGGVEGRKELSGRPPSNWISYGDNTKVNMAEIYNPFTGEWSVTPEAQVVRNYHSVALLMPDGRVWTAGSSKNHDANSAENRELRIEIFEPSYYGLPTRPVIHDVIPEEGDVVTGLRGECTIITDGASEIKRVAIIRNGSVTHGFNSDQRYVGLPFTTQHHHGTLKALHVTIPDNPNIVVPGQYMLFLIDKNGVPSAGTFINIRFGWSDWENLGGPIRSAPSVVSWGKDRLDVFAQGMHNELAHKAWNGNSWSNWADLGGPIISPPCAVSWGKDRLDVFAQGERQELAHKAWNGNSWSNWADLGGPIISPPCAVSWGKDRLDVFAQGERQELAHKAWNGNSWSNWADLGGPIASPPCAVSWGKDRLDVFAQGISQELVHKAWNGISWSNWANLGGPIASPPCAVSWGKDRLDVFAQGISQELVHKAWNGISWSNWANLGGPIASPPCAVSWGKDRLDVFAQGISQELAHKAWNGISWSNWANLGGPIISPPCAVSWGENRLDVFVRSLENNLMHKYW